MTLVGVSFFFMYIFIIHLPRPDGSTGWLSVHSLFSLKYKRVDHLSYKVFNFKMLRTQVDQLASRTWVDQLSFSMYWLTNVIFKFVCRFVYLLFFLYPNPPYSQFLFFIYLSIYLFMHVSINLSIYLSIIYLSIHPSIHPSVQLWGGERKVPIGHPVVNK